MPGSPRTHEDAARNAAYEFGADENRLTIIETDIALIKAETGEIRIAMAKNWAVTGMAWTFAILGGVAGLPRLLHELRARCGSSPCGVQRPS